jgi:hypothetical protein
MRIENMLTFVTAGKIAKEYLMGKVLFNYKRIGFDEALKSNVDRVSDLNGLFDHPFWMYQLAKQSIYLDCDWFRKYELFEGNKIDEDEGPEWINQMSGSEFLVLKNKLRRLCRVLREFQEIYSNVEEWRNILVVSNEFGFSAIPMKQWQREFLRRAAELNHLLSEECDSYRMFIDPTQTDIDRFLILR